ncbi:hypothetical protein [Megasphaera sp.]|uniref:hypothetical protein n=1 Tax=Megasphaera sp. TaxID=2023260 RepID=UPI001D9B7C59|nr:hypothetical protein [Megasphaera sp.]MBS6104476.1 hypothetical protein [Megasphaera sp.]
MKETLNLDLVNQLIPQLVNLAKEHWTSCDWQYGPPVEIFADTGYICIRYEKGNCWHYDLKNNLWF